jgi:putative addiction module component (TIGR02574 family)
MAPTLEQFGIDQLSVEDRWALAQLIWDSIAADIEQQPLTAEERAELERRVAAADANPGEGIPWEVVRAAARSRWQR